VVADGHGDSEAVHDELVVSASGEGALTFVFEAIALMSFGFSWMIKGRLIDLFEDEAVMIARQARDA